LGSLFACIGTCIAIYLIEIDVHPDAKYSILYNLVIAASFGFLCFTALSLIAEVHCWKGIKKIVLMSGGLCFLGVYYCLLPENWLQSNEAEFIRIILLTISFFLLVFIAPFLSHFRGNNIFWQFNRRCISRILFAFIYGGILFAGMAIAYASIENLFDIDIHDELYPATWAFVTGICCTHFVLSGIPFDFQKLAKDYDYPKSIKFFAQYIVIPLMTVYGVILSVYLGKILVTGVWPKGMVAWLILLFSAAGILAYMLLHPLRNFEHRWIRYFSIVFFVLEIPFVGMLFAALYIRVQEYGLTELRYYVFMLGLWLLGMVMYFLLQVKPRLKAWPMSLFVLLLLSSFGPWGAIHMSKVNQFHRLQSVLEEHNLLIDGKIQKDTDQDFDKKTLRAISGGFDYFEEVHGYKDLQQWFGQDLKTYAKSKEDERRDTKSISDDPCWKEACFIVEGLLNVDYIEPWEYHSPTIGDQKSSYYRSHSQTVLEVSGYDYFFDIWLNHPVQEHAVDIEKKILLGDNNYVFGISKVGLGIEITKNDILEIVDLESMISNLKISYKGRSTSDISRAQMTLFSKDQSLKLEITGLQIDIEGEKEIIRNIELRVFVKNITAMRN